MTFVCVRWEGEFGDEWKGDAHLVGAGSPRIHRSTLGMSPAWLQAPPSPIVTAS